MQPRLWARLTDRG